MGKNHFQMDAFSILLFSSSINSKLYCLIEHSFHLNNFKLGYHTLKEICSSTKNVHSFEKQKYLESTFIQESCTLSTTFSFLPPRPLLIARCWTWISKSFYSLLKKQYLQPLEPFVSKASFSSMLLSYNVLTS